MDMQLLTDFFMWCSIINGGFLLVWGGIYALAPNLLFKTQRLFFTGSRASFERVMYVLLGIFKMLFLLFNVTPYLALLVIG